MNPYPKLLDHPFYKAWFHGKVSHRDIGLYHQSYGDFIRAIPTFWRRVVDELRRESAMGNIVVQDELLHTVLWENWNARWRTRGKSQLLQGTILAFESMTPSALLGAIHAFEIQQPELAFANKECLIQHYAIPEADLAYFDEHLNEAAHIEFGAWLGRHFADPEEFADGFIHGAGVVYHSLDVFAAS